MRQFLVFNTGMTATILLDATGQFQVEILGLVEPKSKEANRICQEDLNEVITAFVEDKQALECGLFDGEHVGGDTLPEELTQLRMGKIIRGRYPELDEEDQEAVRQHAVAALNLVKKRRNACFLLACQIGRIPRC
ncbi:hypothetical protein ABIE28_000038 [Devosia sp. 2618]